jgi:hypothetical protein
MNSRPSSDSSHDIILSSTCPQIPHHVHRNHDARRSLRRQYCSPVPSCPQSDYISLAQDISAAEQVSLNHLTVPELSPSDPSSNATSPSSSEPVTPVDPPSLAAPLDPLVAGKHQPAPRPYRPIAKITSRGTVWRAGQALFSLGKRKRQPSEDAGIPSTVDVQVLESDEEEAAESPAETTPPASQVSHPFPRTAYSFARVVASQSLFTLPNVPLDGTPTQARPHVRMPADFAAYFFLHAH